MWAEVGVANFFVLSVPQIANTKINKGKYSIIHTSNAVHFIKKSHSIHLVCGKFSLVSGHLALKSRVKSSLAPGRISRCSSVEGEEVDYIINTHKKNCSQTARQPAT